MATVPTPSTGDRVAGRATADVQPLPLALPTPPPRGASPRQLATAYAGVAGLGIYLGAWSALLPAIREQVGAGDAVFGLALLVGSMGSLPAPLLLGPLLGRARNRALCAALLVVAASCPLPALARTPLALATTLVVISMTSGALDVVWNGVIAAHERRAGRSLMQQAHAVYPVTFLAAALATGAVRAAGVDPLRVLLGAAALIVLIAAANWRTESPAIDSGAARPRGRVPRPLLILGSIGLLAYIAESALASWSAIHLQSTLGSGPFLAACAPASVALAMTAGRLAAHRHAGRGSAGAMTAGAFAAIAGFLLLALAPNALLGLLGCFIAGAGIAPWAPGIFAAAGRIGAQMSRGSAIAVVTTICYVGLFVGPGAVGIISGLTNLRVAIALVAPVCALLLWGLRRPYVRALLAGGVAPSESGWRPVGR